MERSSRLLNPLSLRIQKGPAAMTAAEQRLMLSRLEAACRQTRWNLDLIVRQIGHRAGRMADGDHGACKRPSVRPSLSLWTPAGDRRFHEYVSRNRFERHAEIDALSRGLARQEQAPAAARSRLPQTYNRVA
ncbi:hypothetical protein [Rhizobium leguminosarum]|uniref:hypothetical protein n=1 Tax=Rhizobium leguminosarum TaxID=384 RepID=UPI001D85A3CE|nr:hypothetical protein [Rhizobium leguminosarum]MBP2449814.1 hypothetical protein [Rhizobium leguminosarum]